MKTRILSLVVLTIVTITTTFAKNVEERVNQKALATFAEKFADARNVNWVRTGDYYRATFTLNSQSLTAYVTETGAWIGVMKHMLSNQLPINLQTALKGDYGQHWISELFEFSTEDNTTYYVIVENADQKITLKGSANSGWSVFKKEKKTL